MWYSFLISFVLTAALGADASVKLPLFETLVIGKHSISGSIAPLQAKELLHSKECRNASHTPPASDKFAEIDRNLLQGRCWIVEQVAQATPPTARLFSPALSEFTDIDQLSESLFPPRSDGDSFKISRQGNVIEITSGLAENGFLPGYTVRYHLISRGSFNHQKSEEILFRKESSANGATFSECEMVILGEKDGSKIDVIARKAIGRCA